MAGSEYMKVAAGNLRKAASAMRSDIAEVEKTMRQTEHDIRAEVDEMKKQINNNKLRIATPDATDIERAARLRENGKLDSQIADRQHQLAAYRGQSNQQIQDIQRRMSGLEQEASGLEKSAGFNSVI